MWEIWFIIGLIFTIAQIYYKGFFFLWFTIGSLVAFISSFFSHHLLIESIIFLITSFMLLFILTPYLTRKFISTQAAVTNTNKLVGRQGIVIKSIGKTHLESGLVKLDGETWSAVSNSNAIIPVGSLVEVQSIKGIRLTITHTHKP